MNVLQAPLPSALGALLLLLGCTAKVDAGRTSEEPLPVLVAQRVTATVQRKASRLVRLETAREAFLTTPEHPFATPRPGWIPAGRLVPGDWVVSERFGAVRLLSVRSEPAARPVPVFNLSVASSHAYFVGIDRVLVHNTTCKTKDSESRDEAIAEAMSARDELDRQIEALTQTDPKSPRIAELKAQRNKLRKKINYLQATQRKNQGVAGPSWVQQNYAADNEAARKGLEAAQKELHDLEGRQPTSEAENHEFAARRKDLEKEISAQTLTYDRTNRILAWLRELAELEKATPATDAERLAVEEKKKKLSADVRLEQKRARAVKDMRRKRAAPEGREERAKYQRDLNHRLRRLPVYVADTERARDRFELAVEELAGLRQAPRSETRDARIHHLTEQIELTREIALLEREKQNAGG